MSETKTRRRPAPRPPAQATAATTPNLDVEAMQRLLDGEYRVARNRLRDLLRQPRFAYRYELPKEEYREVVWQWLQEVARHGFGAAAYPVEHGGGGDVGLFLANSETLAFHDHSLTVKFGVQFGLFGGSIALLGTERHHAKYLPKVGTAELAGCFAMSELGHGSNVRDILTEARYDAATEEFVIHTPNDAARKEWIGNAAKHGSLATVFAQLWVGETCHGVHAILVPIRDARGEVLPGVRIGDCGEKAGLNGIDNGRLWFDQVRVPRENLLNRYGDVAADGTYSSSIANPSRRFFTMLSTLVGGRISVASCALSAAKSGLAIAVKYGAERRQFGGDAGEVPILDYRTHQRRLFPALAGTYLLDAALKDLTRRFKARTAQTERQIETLAAGLKAYVTWHTARTLQQARECCGGQGYLTANRICVLRNDTDISVTFEGDNTVLYQLVAKSLLTDYKQQVGGHGIPGLLRYVTRRAQARLAAVNPIVARNTDSAHLRSLDFHLDTLRYREGRLLQTAAARLRQRIQDGMDSFDALIEVQDHLMALAEAHVERVILESAARWIASPEAAPVRPHLERLAALFALSLLERDEGWYLARSVVEPGKARAIRAEVNALLAELRPDAVALVDAFGIPAELLGAPIAETALPRDPAQSPADEPAMVG